MICCQRLIISKIAFYVQDVSTSLVWEDKARHYAIRPDIRQCLTALRLVNKNFYNSASPILSRHVIAKTASNQASRPLKQLIKFSNSQSASYVYQIDFGFGDMTSSNEGDSGSYIEDLAEVLSSCLPRFPNLKALQFHSPPLSIPLDQSRAYINTVVSALRSIPLPNLEELEIHFPYTRDFWGLFTGAAQIPIDDVLRPLRHLGIHICENSRPDLPGPQPVNPNVPDNGWFSVSVHKMVQQAPNLESLAICSEEDDFDISNIGFPLTLRLRALHLSGVSTMAGVLLGLAEQGRDTLAFILLERITLYSVDREDVLRQLSNLPRLLNLDVR